MKKKQRNSDKIGNSTRNGHNKILATNYLQVFLALLSIIPISVYFQKISQYALNIPWYDDYDAILDFVSNWIDLSFTDKWTSIFQQHNEHRILHSRLLYVTYYLLTGKINFEHIIFIANFQLLAMWIICCYFSNLHLKPLWGLATFISSLLIFNFNNQENSYWAMAGMQNFGSVALLTVSMFCYQQNSRFWLYGALISQFLCIFSSGNGIIGSISIIFFNLISQNRLKASLSLLSTIIFSTLYYLNYTNTANTLTGKSIDQILNFFFLLSGSLWGFENRLATGIVIYISIIAILFILLKSDWKIPKYYAFGFSVILFTSGTIGSIAVFRSGAAEGVELYSYSARYMILPNLLTLGTAFLILTMSSSYKIKWLVVTISLILSLKAYVNNYSTGIKYIESMYNTQLNRRISYPKKSIKHAEKILEKACEKEIYCR